MKKVFLISIFYLISISLYAQINKNGIPLIKNYSPLEYNAAEQNWAICEDSRGVIYIGNNDEGVLEYDGNTWDKIQIANNSIVRSLEYSSDGVVYVGGVEEFGYLAPDKEGQMHYHSLSSQLDSITFKDVWKIYTLNDRVYFCSQNNVFRFKDKKLEQVYNATKMSFLNFKVNDKIYWGTVDKGLCELTEDSVVLAVGGEFYKDYDIFTMLPWSENEILITTMGQGVYIYNSETGLSKTLQSSGGKFNYLAEYLNSIQAYSAIPLSDNQYAIATLDVGCVIINREGEVLYRLDKENGLQDNTVISLYESKNGNLWLSLNKGVSFVELKTPFTKFGHNYGIEGIVLDLIRYKGKLFLTTNTNLYYLEYNRNNLPEFKKMPMDYAVWQMKIFKVPGSDVEKFLFATSNGVYEFVSFNQPPLKITDVSYYSEKIYQSKFNPNKVFIGYTSGLALLEYMNGKWVDQGKVGDFRDKIESITEDSEGNLWLGTALKGVIKLNTDDNTIERLGLNEGMPELGRNKVCFINNEILSTTSKGLYKFNNDLNKFEKYEGFGEKYLENQNEISSIVSFKENEYWTILKDEGSNYEHIEHIKISQDRIVSINDIPFKRLYKQSINKITFDQESGIWILTSDAIYNYKEQFQEDFSKYFGSLIRQIEIGIDSVIFWGTYYKDTANLVVDIKQPDALKVIVPYKDRSFQFYYSTPYFPNDEIKYSHRLHGYEESWSPWSPETKSNYTNLNEGHYTFMVKAKNIYGFESEIAKYEFTIKPPWYKTIVAYFGYFILAIILIIVIVKVYTRRLELEKIRLEQIVKERTEEVVRQKEEIEKQRDEIAEKNQSITDSIEYASRIQKAVLPSNEFAKEILPEHFILFRPRDIVSGDFYWMTRKDNLLVMIAADCTGHGVPGAFMSMLGVSFLNEIVNRHEITTAGAILTQLRADVKKTLGQEGKEGEAKDGMDIALCIMDLDHMKLQYAGAYNPFYLFRNNELMEIKADRMPIGIYIKEKESFTNNEIDLQKDDVFYIFSDGFQDQFGGEDGQKYKTKNFKQLLLEIHNKPMAEQREILNTTIDQWRGKWEQVDDIIIMGVRV